jgi:single-strand DNA-binding protein
VLNKVCLMGRLTRDPETRVTPSNVTVASFTLAVDRNFARQGEQRQTDFINIVTFSRTAEFVSKYFSKGQLVAVVGRIQSRSWEDQSGNKRYAVEVVAEECHFAEPKRDGSLSQNAPAADQAYGQPASIAPSDNDDFAPLFDDDDNLPF